MRRGCSHGHQCKCVSLAVPIYRAVTMLGVVDRRIEELEARCFEHSRKLPECFWSEDPPTLTEDTKLRSNFVGLSGRVVIGREDEDPTWSE